MTSLIDLREVVDVVIGVDTHVLTHSAAVVDARTGGVVDEITVEATADGYTQPQATAGTARPCRCCWPRAAPQSRPQPTPSDSCSAS